MSFPQPQGFPPPPQIPGGRPPAGAPPKSPGIAVLLSFLWLGAGHLYAEKVGTGVVLLIWNFLLVVLGFTFVGLIVAFPLWLVSAPIVMILASSAANRFNERHGFRR